MHCMLGLFVKLPLRCLAGQSHERKRTLQPCRQLTTISNSSPLVAGNATTRGGGLVRPIGVIRRKPKIGSLVVQVAAADACLVSSGWPIWTVMALCAGFAQFIENRTMVGRWASGPLLSMLIAATAASLNIIPNTCAAYDIVWDYLMPLAAALYLLEADLRRLTSTAGSALIAFLVGAVGTVLGTFLSYAAVGSKLGVDGYKVAASLCASYIGGAINFAATAQALGLVERATLASCMAADNIAMAAYLAAVMSMPAEETVDEIADENAEAKPQVTAETLSLSFMMACVSCLVGQYVAKTFFKFPPATLTVTALVASLCAYLSPKKSPLFTGAEAVGGGLMLLFFATIGAGAGLTGGLAQSPFVFVFILMQLAVHLLVTLGVGKMLKLPMQALLVASNANVGGPATAAAMAGARGWPHMIPPAMLTGSLGYAIGTMIGCTVGHFLKG